MSDLPRELAELYAADRSAPAAGSAARGAIRAKLAATVGHAPLGAAAAGGGIAKIIAIVALTIGAGTATVAALRHESAPNPTASALPTHIEQPPSARTVAVAAKPAAPPPPTAPMIAAAPRPVPPSTRPRRATPVTSVALLPVAALPNDVPNETELMRNAWLALAANRPERALALVDDDLRLHPTGALTEERDALQVLALASANRADDARAAAQAFLEKYPNSVHRDRVVRALPEGSR